MKKILMSMPIYLLIVALLVTSAPISAYADNSVKKIEAPLELSAADRQKQKLKQQTALQDEAIQELLDQGYTLEDLEKASSNRGETRADLEASLTKVKPHPVNESKNAKSKITSELGIQDYSASLTSSSTDPATDVDYRYVNTKPDEAPYSVNLDNETISTLSGALVLRETDLTLPGRNGLSFALTRSYDSGSSQYYQMAAVGDENRIVVSTEDKMFPIGKGWTWDISYIEKTESGDTFLHLAGSGVYQFKPSENDKLIGYPWKDLSLALDYQSITVNGEVSRYVLTSTQGIKQYFNDNGRLIRIADSYNNVIDFKYEIYSFYGNLLSSITDAIGNTIQITYGPESVVMKSGNEVVTYYKAMKNGREILTHVVDQMGRQTTYDYDLRAAQFSLKFGLPNMDNPYALITGVTHPTGAKSVYQYEQTATIRRIAENGINQVYRIISRENHIPLSTGLPEVKYHKDITYTGDMGSSYNADIPAFSVTINDGLTQSTFLNEKDFLGSDIPAAFYMNKITTVAGSNSKTTTHTYDRTRKISTPISTTVVTNNTPSTALTDSKTYDDYGNVTSTTNPLGIKVTYGYDATSHLLTSISTPISATQTQYTEYVRDAVHGSITAARIRNGGPTGAILQETRYENFDAYGNALSTEVFRSDGVFTLTTNEYSPAYQGAFLTKQTVTGVKDADGTTLPPIIQQYAYDLSTGRLTTYTDANLNQTSYQYDALGRVTKAINPDSSFSSINYLDISNQIEITDETGVTSLTSWNPLGMKVDSGIMDGPTYKSKAKYGYDGYGRLAWTEDAIGNRIQYGYDVWSRQVSITYPDNAVATVSYDDINNTKTVTDAEGYKIKEYYDKIGRKLTTEETKTVNAASQTNILATYTYDNAGKVLTATEHVTPALTTTYGYDVLGRLTLVKNAKNETTSYLYDWTSNLTTVTHPDNKTNVKKYDEIGRLIQSTDANGKSEKFFYDANGNKTGYRDKKNTSFSYTFDNRNRLVHADVLNAQAQVIAGDRVSFTYDSASRRTTMTDATGTTGYEYAPSTGALSQMTYPDGKSIQYDYDAAGNRSVMKDPFDYNVYYKYDMRNRLQAVGSSLDFNADQEVRYEYYANDLLKKINQRNGVTTDYSYNGLRLDTLTEKKADGTLLNQFAYAYSNNGNMTSKIENGTSNTFTYDSLNRIETSTQFNEVYAYDSRGNRATQSTSQTAESPDATYNYDKRDQLVSVVRAQDNHAVTYSYNGDGLLWERSEGGQVTRYYYDGDQVIAEGNVVGGVSTLKARYLRGQGLIAREDDEGKAYYLQNGHGDVVELRDSTGDTRLNRYSYDMWGNPIVAEESVQNPFRYSGEMTDSTTTLQYLRARWYDPSLGRFINEDSFRGTLTSPLSQNLYTYVHNNPLIYADPTGNWCEATVNGKVYSHPGGCNDGNSGQERFYGQGYSPDYANNGRSIFENGIETGFFIVGFGSVIDGKTYELGVKGWTFRVDKAHDEATGQRHIHISGTKGQSWSQNTDGSPHDKGGNSPGSPPNSMKKELAKKGIWDWDSKAKSYAENDVSNFYAYYSESETYYFESLVDYNMYKVFGELSAGDGKIVIQSNGMNMVIPKGSPLPGGIKLRLPRFSVPAL